MATHMHVIVNTVIQLLSNETNYDTLINYCLDLSTWLNQYHSNFHMNNEWI